MVFEDAFSSRHFSDHLNHLVGKPVRERLNKLLLLSWRRKRRSKIGSWRRRGISLRRRGKGGGRSKIESWRRIRRSLRSKRRGGWRSRIGSYRRRERLLQMVRESVQK